MKLPFIIKKPIITEQSMLATTKDEYTFEVDPKATKGQIKQAVETYFGVDVIKVRTSKSAGKTKRAGKLRKTVQHTDKKKAVVKIKSGQKIEAFDIQG